MYHNIWRLVTCDTQSLHQGESVGSTWKLNKIHIYFHENTSIFNIYLYLHIYIYIHTNSIHLYHNIIMHIYITYIWRLATCETQSLDQGVSVGSARTSTNLHDVSREVNFASSQFHLVSRQDLNRFVLLHKPARRFLWAIYPCNSETVNFFKVQSTPLTSRPNRFTRALHPL